MPKKKDLIEDIPTPGRPLVDDTISDWIDGQQEVINVLDHAKDLHITHPAFYQGRIKTADKFLACAAYMVYGNSRKASSFMGNRVKAGTIRKWVHDATWWPEVTTAIRKAQGEHFDSKLTQVIDKSADVILERLENGDEVIDKNGVGIRKKVGARDAAIVLGQAFDKRALQRGDPTSRSEKTSSDDRLKQLEEKFRAFGADSKLIEGEVIK